MEVVKHGDLYYQLECNNKKCGCWMKYTENDVIEDVGIRKYIRCPECDKEIELED